MMTGALEEEEMMTEVEGEAWMMGHVVVVTIPNPGSHWAGLVVGERGRRLERKAGGLPVMVPLMKAMTLKQKKDPAIASETVVHKERRVSGGEEAQMKAAGGSLAEMTLTAMNVAIAMNAVTETAVTETAAMTVNTEPHPEILKKEALGVVEVMISGRSRTGRGLGKGSVTVREKRVGVVNKKTLDAPRMRPMMMAGPLSDAEQQP